MANADRDAINITPYRWWTFAKTEAEARQLIRQVRERDAAQGLPADTWLDRFVAGAS